MINTLKKFWNDESGATESPGAFPKPIDCFLDAIRRVVRARRAGEDGGAQTH